MYKALKNNDFKEDARRKIGVYGVVTSTTLASTEPAVIAADWRRCARQRCHLRADADADRPSDAGTRQVGPTDVVYDLGSGDGRIPLPRPRNGACGVGVDIDLALIAEARANAKKAGLEDKCNSSRATCSRPIAAAPPRDTFSASEPI